jgi:adenosine deaminase
MFNTNLTEEYLRINDQFGFAEPQLRKFVFNAARASLLPENEKTDLIHKLTTRFDELDKELAG